MIKRIKFLRLKKRRNKRKNPFPIYTPQPNPHRTCASGKTRHTILISDRNLLFVFKTETPTNSKSDARRTLIAIWIDATRNVRLRDISHMVHTGASIILARDIQQ